jgi:hypothetical protein
MSCSNYTNCKSPVSTGKCKSCVGGSGYDPIHAPEFDLAVKEGRVYMIRRRGVMGERGVYVYPRKEYKVLNHTFIPIMETDVYQIETELEPIVIAPFKDELTFVIK